MNKDKKTRKKTRQDKLLELFPNVSQYESVINIMPCTMDTKYHRRKTCRGVISCGECAEEYWNEVVE